MIGNIGRSITVVGLTLLICMVLCGCREKERYPDAAKPPALSDAQYKKEMDEIRKSLKGDLKIRLKKDGKGAYSWEITGKDPQQIIQANQTLNKRINSDGHE